jgi:hypothetical protein
MRAFVVILLATVVTVIAQSPVGPHGEPAKAIAVHAPKPTYPESLKKRGIGGHGDFVMHVEVKNRPGYIGGRGKEHRSSCVGRVMHRCLSPVVIRSEQGCDRNSLSGQI